ncbi:hypothetical protein ACIBCU_37610 [Streptomyces sp. NPDC051064]|uniref:hypothetical protein n=1 Tax=Streptomyces sp. NPDC051064 TaxID=3365641 RepID=UPI0037982E2F
MLTLDQYRDDHGDPATWMPADIDSYLDIADMAPPEPLPYTYAQMQTMGAEYEQWAQRQQLMADRLANQGRKDAAGIWQRSAQESHELAAAARMGWPAFEAHLNGW